MTGTIAESIYNFLDVNDKLPVEQKRCKKKGRKSKHQLLIDNTILRDCRKRHTYLWIAWIDYKKAYDMVSHSWIIESLEQVPDNICKFVKRSMANWQTKLTSCWVWRKLTSGEGFFRVIVYHLCYLWYAWYC